MHGCTQTGLTPNVHDPLSSLQQVDVVCRENKIDELIDQEDMPFHEHIRRIPERYQGENKGWKGHNESGHTRDPSEGVDHTAPVALVNCQQLYEALTNTWILAWALPVLGWHVPVRGC